MFKNLKSGVCMALLTTMTLVCLGTVSDAVAQESFPNKSIRLVVPFAPGGVTDTSGRLIAENLSKRLGQQVYVENKPGASGNIGTAQVANAEPDGYTLVLGFDGTMVINPHVFPKVGFDTAKDFAPIGKIGDAILILVSHPGVPAKTLKEMIALSKTQSGGLSYGTSGTGGALSPAIDIQFEGSAPARPKIIIASALLVAASSTPARRSATSNSSLSCSLMPPLASRTSTPSSRRCARSRTGQAATT